MGPLRIKSLEFLESICHFEVLRATKDLAGDGLMECRIIRLDRDVSLA